MTDRDTSVEHDKLVEQAAEAMRRNRRTPELPVLRALSDDMLRAVIGYHGGPHIVA